MRIAHLADLHLTDGPRLDDQAETLARVVSDIVATRPDLVIIAGDLSGKTVPHRTTPREREVLYPALVRLAQVAPVEIVYGNHDQAPDLDGLAHLDGQWPIRVRSGAGTDLVQTPSGQIAVYWLAYPTKRWLLAGQEADGLAGVQRQIQDRLALLFKLWGARIKRSRARQPDLAHVFEGHVQVSGSRTSGGEVLAGQEIEITRDDLDGLGIDYGALGHIHKRQEIAPRCWYSGSPWRNDYAETEMFKAWHLVDFPFAGGWKSEPLVDVGEPLAVEEVVFPVPCSPADARLLVIPTDCRRRVTLDYRWAQPDDEDHPRWTRHPARAGVVGELVEAGKIAVDDNDVTEARRQLKTKIRNADVRMRLTVPQQWAASCPWTDEVERVRQLGAHRIDTERVIEPVLRVRAPAVAEAGTLEDKLRAYWKSTATELTSKEQASALGCLGELQTCEDEQIESTGRTA